MNQHSSSWRWPPSPPWLSALPPTSTPSCQVGNIFSRDEDEGRIYLWKGKNPHHPPFIVHNPPSTHPFHLASSDPLFIAKPPKNYVSFKYQGTLLCRILQTTWKSPKHDRGLLAPWLRIWYYLLLVHSLRIKDAFIQIYMYFVDIWCTYLWSMILRVEWNMGNKKFWEIRSKCFCESVEDGGTS